MRRLLLLLVLFAFLGTSCDRASDATTTTADTSPTTPTTTLTTETTALVTTTVAVETTTTLPSSVITLEYQVRFKGTTDGRNIVILQIDEGTATDIALESLARQAVDEFEPLAELFVVDSEEAIELVRLDPTGLTDAEKDILAQHYLLHVNEAVLTFQGPFADLGGFVLGS